MIALDPRTAFIRAVEAAYDRRMSDVLRLRPGQHGKPGEIVSKLAPEIREALKDLASEEIADLHPLPWMLLPENTKGRGA